MNEDTDQEDSYEDIEEDDEDSEKNVRTVLGTILIFSFISILAIFSISLITVTTNNYVILNLFNITNTFATTGTIPASYVTVAENLANNYPKIIDYFDLLWLLSFVSMVVSSIGYSYYAKRESYFSILSLAVLGILFLSFIGGIFIQISNWFKINFMAIFPSILPKMPMFTYYLNHAGVINLILIIVCLVVNFIDLDLNKFSDRKLKDQDKEI